MKFSIIIPTYNRGDIVCNAIRSVLAQTCQNWELIIVDDGSTDATDEIIRPFLSDERITYIYKKNGGPSSARNVGLARALGQFVTYIDSDDHVFPEYLVEAERSFKQHPESSFALVNGTHQLEFYDKDLRATKDLGFTYNIIPKIEDFYDWKVKSAVGTGFFFKRDSFHDKVKWNETFSPLEELDFFMQFAVLDPLGFLFIPHVLYDYKQRWGVDGQCSNASYLQWAQSFQCIFDLHKDDPLMRNPEIFSNRVAKYQQLHESFLQGKEVPPVYRHFPEFYNLCFQDIS